MFTSHTYALLLSILSRKHWLKQDTSWIILPVMSTEEENSFVPLALALFLNLCFDHINKNFRALFWCVWNLRKHTFLLRLTFLSSGCVKGEHEDKFYHPPLAYFLHCVCLAFLKPYCPVTIFKDVSYIMLKFYLSCYCKAGCDKLFLS